jgi:hypothetical protein
MTGSVTPMADVNSGRHILYGHQPMKMPLSTAVERDPLRSSPDIVWELRLSQLRVLEVLHDDQLHP